MTIRELEDYIKTIPEHEKDLDVVIPMETSILGMFAFQDACPGATQMIDIGPAPDFINDSRENKNKEMKALLIAPHNFPGGCENSDGEINIQPINN